MSDPDFQLLKETNQFKFGIKSFMENKSSGLLRLPSVFNLI